MIAKFSSANPGATICHIDNPRVHRYSHPLNDRNAVGN